MAPRYSETIRPVPGQVARQLRSSVRRWVRPLAAIGIATIVGLLFVLLGSPADIVATLEVIGFSPDRSALLAALILEAGAVVVALLITNSGGGARLGGVLVAAWFFGQTFLDETAKASGGSGPVGTFDPVGWALTLLTLLVTASVVAWMTAVIAIAARVQLVRAWGDLWQVPRTDTFPVARSTAVHRLAQPARVGTVIALLVVTLPVLGDMLNFEPDAHMRADAIGASGPGLTAIPGDTGGPIAIPEIPPTGTVHLSDARPWLASRPSGQGSTMVIDVPSPWSGGASTLPLTIYLPPGYDSHPGIRYPVLYEAPWPASHWFRAVNLQVQMDSLIDSGAIPATVMVFMAQGSGPYPDSECANSFDGREWYDRWVVQTVVPTVDAAVRTIARVGARGLIGFSHGGYCAASLLLRHPDVFGSAIAFSGYYQAGIVTNQTPNAALPFGGNPQLEAAFSPDALAPKLPVATRSRLFLELSTTPTETFYGPQYVTFSRILEKAGIPVVLFPTSVGHSWAEVRAEFAAMVQTWAAELASAGVFAA